MATRTRLDQGWFFHRGDVEGGHREELDHSSWRPQVLPHDWGVEGPYDRGLASATGFLPAGIGWYRTTVQVDAAGDRVFLAFDGVCRNSDVWCNGHHLGHRPSGFAGFGYELTPWLKAGGTQTVAVRVDHSQHADSRWYTGSGINRDVWLVRAGPVRLPEHGVVVTTPVVDPEAAVVRVATEVENSLGADAAVRVDCRLRDAEGTVVAQQTTPLTVAAATTAATSLDLSVPDPRLWSVDDPYLYSLVISVSNAEGVLDQECLPVGIRTVRFDAAAGFFLNGVSLKIKGVCLHDDAGALGTAVPPAVWERRLLSLKAAGTNAVRMSHNPHLPELYDLCDRLGLLVQDEAFDEWAHGKNKWIEGWNLGQPGQDGSSGDFDRWGAEDLTEMVRRNRNHPSVIMWSIGNEIDYPNDPYSHEALDLGDNPQIYGKGYDPDRPPADELVDLGRRLAAVVKEHDVTRPVTAALAAAVMANEVGLSEALDLVGYNYQEYRYAEDHAAHPAWVIYGSENAMDYQAWQAVEDNAFVFGQFLWTGVDYLGESRRWPSRGNPAGLLDLAGFPKPEYEFRRSLWTDEPMAALAVLPLPLAPVEPRRWPHRAARRSWQATVGATARVLCFTNCDRVELFLNGRSLGVRERAAFADRTPYWDVSFEPGELSVLGSSADGAGATDQVRTAGPVVRLLATLDRPTVAADGRDVAHVVVRAVDEQGVLDPTFDAEIGVTVGGAAHLLALDNGDLSSHELGTTGARRAHGGQLLAYVQSRRGSGPATVTVSCAELPSEVVTLDVR